MIEPILLLENDSKKALSNDECLVSNGLIHEKINSFKKNKKWASFHHELKFSLPIPTTAYRHAIDSKTVFCFPRLVHHILFWQCHCHDHVKVQPDPDTVWQGRARR